jgi:DNA modification methylase
MVVDPFAGVGSTLIAAIESNRDCWGAEIDDSYYTKAQSRLIETVEAE